MSIEVLSPTDPCPWPFHPDIGTWPTPTAGTGPDARFVLLQEEVVVARVSVWRGGTAMYRERPTRYFGHVAAIGSEALTTLLAAVAEAEAGPAHTLLGPIDGSTWNRYRVVTDGGDTPPFPLEPTNPAWWVDALESAGYTVGETYWSGVRDVRASPCLAPAHALGGVTFRDLCKDRLADELTGIYDLAVQAFSANPLYTPISPKEFRAMYEPIAGHIDPRLCIIAERDGPVGVMLAIPADASRLVLKTIAVAEEERGTGLGRSLLSEVAFRGQELGYTSLIYALMHEDNRSSAMVRKIARPMRRYALYGFGVDG